MVYVGLCGTCGGQEEVVLRNDIGLSQGKLPVEDFEEFPFYAADVASSKHSGPRRPMDILRRCIVDILNEQSISIGKKKPAKSTNLGGNNQRPKKNALACPLLQFDEQVWSCTLDVHESDQDDG